MTLLFDSEVLSVSEMRNRAFRRQITVKAINDMLDAAGVAQTALGRFWMCGFQGYNPATPTVFATESEAGPNLNLSAAGMVTGNGWYVPPQIAGAGGYGLQNDGGASGYVGTLDGLASNLNLNSKEKVTFVFVARIDSAGEGNAGRIIDKAPLILVWTGVGVNIRFSIDGATTSAQSNNIVTGYWHVITIVYDGTQALGSRVKIYIDGIDQTASDTVAQTSITDAGNTLYVMDNSANARALNGGLGLMAVIPDLAMSQAQVQSLVELRGLFQPTVANQAPIRVPGHLGTAEYDFDGAADPNADHLKSYQVQPLKTNQGTCIVWLSPGPNSYLVNTSPFCVSQEIGAGYDEFVLNTRGDLAGDPYELFVAINAATSVQLRWPINLMNPGLNMVAFGSDGSAISINFNGNNQVITPVGGGNTGQWFGTAVDANVVGFGTRLRATQVTPYDGLGTKILIYDRLLPEYQLQQIYARGFTLNGPRWYPDR